MNTLADEVLAVIFTMVLSDVFVSWGSDLYFVIPNTCRRWRAVCKEYVSLGVGFNMKDGSLATLPRGLDLKGGGLYRAIDGLSLDRNTSHFIVALIEANRDSIAIFEIQPSRHPAHNIMIPPLPRLAAATFNHQDTTDENVASIANSTRLQYITIRNPRITGRNILDRVMGIRFACFTGCVGLDEAAFISMVERSPQLHTLGIGKTLFTDAAMTALGKNCPQLHTLAVDGLTISNEGILAVINGCPDLTNLNISECRLLSIDEVLLALSRKSSRLETLEMEHVIRVLKTSMGALLHGCPRIARVQICTVPLSFTSCNIVGACKSPYIYGNPYNV
jgi:hypothetical protein